jgi:iron complex transport system substrate-binding protein
VRIVSLLPSATEILFAVGAGAEVVGVTFECDFPDEARTCRIVSDTTLTHGLTPAEIDAEVRARLEAGQDLYTLDEGALRELNPDLVLTQDLCAVCAVDLSEVDDALQHLGCQATVLTLDPMTLDEVIASIVTVGRATSTEARATALAGDLRVRLDRVAARVAGLDPPRMAMLEWTDPPFSSGHWVPDMVAAAGAVSSLGTAGQRSVQVTWEALGESRPDLIVVSPCGFRLDGATQLARDVIDRGVLPDGIPVWAVNADAAFVRPGPRVVDGVEALAHIAHPTVAAARPDMATCVRP